MGMKMPHSVSTYYQEVNQEGLSLLTDTTYNTCTALPETEETND